MILKRVMIITGGTGGHIFPGIVISKILKSRGCLIKWIGSNNRLESILVPKYNFDIDFVYIPSFYNLSFLNKIINFFLIPKIILNIISKIKKWKPDIILGFGGYISFFGIISSYFCNIPTMIHEQNSVVGFSNKYLYYISNKVVQAFPGTFNDINIPVVGNPIRSELLSISKPKYRLRKRDGYPINILVIGGSQGCEVINKVIYSIVKIIDKNKFNFWHQVGSKNYNSNLFLGNNYLCVDFINDMKKAYMWADLVICRSGALTVSEISSIGLAAIFIPFIHKDKHQYLNAEFLVKNKAAIMIDEKKLNVEYLLNIILNLNRKKLFNMANLAYINRIKNSNEKFINEIYNI